MQAWIRINCFPCIFSVAEKSSATVCGAVIRKLRTTAKTRLNSNFFPSKSAYAGKNALYKRFKMIKKHYICLAGETP